MNKPAEEIYSMRPTITFELPLPKNTRILSPDQAMIKIGNHSHDLGAFCYAQRSDKKRGNHKACEVVVSSIIRQRPKQILQLIKALSSFVTDGGKRVTTLQGYALYLKLFLDLADVNGQQDCLSGGEATRKAYLLWAENTHEQYRRQEFGEQVHNKRLRFIRELLEAATDVKDLQSGTPMVKLRSKPNSITDPLAPHDFAHAVALNQAIFDGLCDLVLDEGSFPYKLVLPETLCWDENHLWLFPTTVWRLPPHKWGIEREKLKIPHWAYNYAEGRLATVDEIEHRYSKWRYPSASRKSARKLISDAQNRIVLANSDVRSWPRIMLGMFAHNAFLFLFFCNTGANESVVKGLETDGEIDSSATNPRFRSLKFRAGGKTVFINIPAAFMPSLRRFMKLREYLLDGDPFPYLFFTVQGRLKKPPRRLISEPLASHYRTLLLTIDPMLPRMGPRVLRASVADWYQRHHDASVTAKVLQNSEQTAQKHYNAGSVADHREELSVFLNSVSLSAKRQRVTANRNVSARPLDEGGCCESFGHPEMLADGVPVKPNCKDSQGCLFCTHRVLVACEEDARKIASAAFVMEQLILGPTHEEFMRPLIDKCDTDLEKIAAFQNSKAMVKRVRRDVFENGNLTTFFADKYQLFLELGVVA